MSSWIATTSIPLLEQWLAFSEARHELLAANVANLDTPGYRARDLSVPGFQQKLREALAAPVFSHRSSPGERVKPNRSDRFEHLAQEFPSLLRHDGTEVSMEQQIAELTKNQMMHNLIVSLLNSQIRLLQAAISERV